MASGFKPRLSPFKMITTGILKYYNNWAILWLDEEIAFYYRSLLPKYLNVQPPMNHTHISVVRKFESPNKLNWGKYEGHSIEVEYNLPVYSDGIYFWLDAYSKQIELIRQELELPKYLGDFTCYHITIGNVK